MANGGNKARNLSPHAKLTLLTNSINGGRLLYDARKGTSYLVRRKDRLKKSENGKNTQKKRGKVQIDIRV